MSKLKYFLFLSFFSFFLFSPLNSFAATPTDLDIWLYFTDGTSTKCTDLNYCFTSNSQPLVNRVSIKTQSYSIIEGSKYDVYSSVKLWLLRNNLDIRNDFYIGNFAGNQWNSQSNVTWNNLDSVEYDSFGGFYILNWGLVQNFTSSFSTSGITWDFYFNNPTRLSRIEVTRFELLNTGNSTGDAINNMSNNIINNNNENTQNIINSQNEIKDFLNNDDPPESDISSLGNVQGLLPPGPVDSLLNIPFKFLSIIISSLGDNCTPLSMNWVFDKTLTLPCFSDSFYNNVPSGLMIFINLIPSGFILITYFKYLYKKVNRAVSLETTSDDEWGVL